MKSLANFQLPNHCVGLIWTYIRKHACLGSATYLFRGGEGTRRRFGNNLFIRTHSLVQIFVHTQHNYEHILLADWNIFGVINKSIENWKLFRLTNMRRNEPNEWANVFWKLFTQKNAQTCSVFSLSISLSPTLD